MSPKRYTARINYSVTADLALKAASPRKRQQPRSDESSGAKDARIGARRGRRGENAAARRCNTVAAPPSSWRCHFREALAHRAESGSGLAPITVCVAQPAMLAISPARPRTVHSPFPFRQLRVRWPSARVGSLVFSSAVSAWSVQQTCHRINQFSG